MDKNFKLISLYVGEKTYKAIKKVADKEEIKMTELLRRIIAEYLKIEGINI